MTPNPESPYFRLAAGLARSQSSMGPLFDHGLKVDLAKPATWAGLNRLATPGSAADDRDRILAALTAKRKVLLVALNQKLEDLARSRTIRSVTSDDAMRIVTGWPEAAELDPRWIGAVWRQGPWKKSGVYVPSLRRTCHARPIPVWVLDEERGE